MDDDTSTMLSLAVACLLVAAIIITLNLLTILVIYKTPKLHTTSNIYIFSLAVADLFVGMWLFMYSFFLIPLNTPFDFDSSNWVCVWTYTFGLSTISISALHLMCISIDRCVYIHKPFVYEAHVGTRVTYAIVSCLWMFGALFVIFPTMILSRDFYDYYNDVPCTVYEILHLKNMLTVATVIYFMTALVAAVMYVQILRIAFKQRSLINGVSVSSESSYPNRIESIDPNLRGTVKSIPCEETSDFLNTTDFGKRGQSSYSPYRSIIYDSSVDASTIIRFAEYPNGSDFQKNLTEPERNGERSTQTSSVKRVHHSEKGSQRVIRFLFTVYGVFIITVTPAMVLTNLRHYGLTEGHDIIYQVVLMLAASNSGANFIIFYLLSSTFREGLQRRLKAFHEQHCYWIFGRFKP